jgi:hypothetical protein
MVFMVIVCKTKSSALTTYSSAAMAIAIREWLLPLFARQIPVSAPRKAASLPLRLQAHKPLSASKLRQRCPQHPHPGAQRRECPHTRLRRKHKKVPPLELNLAHP